MIYTYLGGDSSAIEHKGLILSTVARSAASIGEDVEDLTNEISTLTGFKRLSNFIESRPGTWILNDTLLLHLFPFGFPHPYVQISRDIPWVTSTPSKNCIGLYTQSMFLSHQTIVELTATLAKKQPIRLPAGFNILHVTSDYEPDSNETVGRHGLATASWARVATADIHYRYDFFLDEGLPKVWDIFSAMDATANVGDLLIFTNRDICLVPESTAILRAFMLNRGIASCYGQRVDITQYATLTHEDITSGQPYPGMDLFAWYAGSLFEPEEGHRELLLGREGWDAAFRDAFGGVSHKIPYNVCYHVMHESPWQTLSGKEGNNHNRIALSKIGTKAVAIGPNITYKPDLF